MHRLFYAIAILTALYASQAHSPSVAAMSIVGGVILGLVARLYQIARRNYGFVIAPASVPSERRRTATPALRRAS